VWCFLCGTDWILRYYLDERWILGFYNSRGLLDQPKRCCSTESGRTSCLFSSHRLLLWHSFNRCWPPWVISERNIKVNLSVGVEINLHTFLTSAPDEGIWLTWLTQAWFMKSILFLCCKFSVPQYKLLEISRQSESCEIDIPYPYAKCVVTVYTLNIRNCSADIDET
jgi:hypothetical protein